jgi:hypothetical protein
VSGDTVVVGAPLATFTGAAHVFSRAGERWTQHATLVPTGTRERVDFGTSVAVHGSEIVVGAPLATAVFFSTRIAVYRFTNMAGTWTPNGTFGRGNTADGAQVALDTWIAVGVPGDDSIVTPPGATYTYGGTDSGAVYVF